MDEKAKYTGKLQTCNLLGTDPSRADPPIGMAFEVNRICRKDGQRRIGWFCDPTSKTQLYLFSFPALVNRWDPSWGIQEKKMKIWLFPKRRVVELAA